MRNVVRYGFVAAATAAAWPAAAQDARVEDWMWRGGWGGMMFGGLSMVLFWGLLIVLIVLGLRWLPGRGLGPDHSLRPNALDLLRDRFARGEIDAAEFKERKRLLED